MERRLRKEIQTQKGKLRKEQHASKREKTKKKIIMENSLTV